MPQISVIVPVYNVERYLPRCINSILNQTFPDFELILVDDGSSDNCPFLCDEFQSKDKRVKTIHKQNGGLSSARNAGIELAEGEYISFIDSDDWIESNMLQELYELAVSNKADVVECAFQRVEEDELPQKLCNNTPHISERSGEFAIMALYLGEGATPVVWNKLYKRQIFNKLRFPVGMNYEDSYLMPQIVYAANKVVYTTYVGYYYFQRCGSITKSEFSVKNTDKILAYEGVRYFLLKNGLYRALAYNDATLAFVMIKTIEKLKKSKLDDELAKTLQKDFDRLFFDFLGNSVLNWKSKIVLVGKRIQLSVI